MQPATAHLPRPQGRRAALPGLAGISFGALLVLALGLRVSYYLVDPTLSSDEAQLALNVLHRSYGGLLDTLDFNQAGPPAFLELEKVAVSAFGRSDYALRILPLLGALAAALLFHPVMSRLVGRRAAYAAFALFAVSGLLLTYAATSKQYSTDVVIALVLYATVTPLTSSPTRARLALAAVVGATAVWISHPAAFIEAGIGSVLIVEELLARRWRRARDVTAVSGVWLASFLAVYLLTAPSYSHLQNSFAGSTAVLGAGGPGQVRTYAGAVRGLLGIAHFGFPIRNAIGLAAALLGATGFVALLIRRRTDALLLVAPAFFALVASAIGKYPFFSRTLLFLVPALLALIGYGTVFCIERASRAAIRAVPCAAFAAVVVGATLVPIHHLHHRDGREFKQAISYLATHQRRGDSLYVFSAAQYDLRYYLECGCFARGSVVERARRLWPLRPAPGGVAQSAPALRSVPPRLVIGTSTGEVPADYRADFASLRGRARVWVLVAAAPGSSGHAVLALLDRLGAVRRTAFSRGGIALAALYDLSG